MDIAFEVVSCPAIRSTVAKRSTSFDVRCRPSSSDSSRRLKKSSPGCSRFSAIKPEMYADYSPLAAAASKGSLMLPSNMRSTQLCHLCWSS